MGVGVGWGSPPLVVVPWYQAGGAPLPLAAYQPKGSASLAASYVNLANPGTYDAAPGVAPTFDAATGWTFNGSTQYLTTAITIGSHWSVVCRYSNVVAGTIALFGCDDASGAGLKYYPNLSSNHYFFNGATVKTVAGGTTSGVAAIADTIGYLDGASQATGMEGTPPARTMYIGANNRNNTSVIWYCGCKVQAFAIYNSGLTGPQVEAISAAMAAL